MSKIIELNQSNLFLYCVMQSLVYRCKNFTTEIYEMGIHHSRQVMESWVNEFVELHLIRDASVAYDEAVWGRYPERAPGGVVEFWLALHPSSETICLTYDFDTSDFRLVRDAISGEVYDIFHLKFQEASS